jgi:hypothetical protein
MKIINHLDINNIFYNLNKKKKRKKKKEDKF